MPKQPNIQFHTLTNGGGTINLSCAASYDTYVIEGTAVLSSSWTIQADPADTPLKETIFDIFYRANVTPGGNTVTIFTYQLTSEEVANNIYIRSIWDGAAWNTYVIPDFESTQFIATADIKDAAVTNAKLADLTEGNIKIGNNSNRPADLDISTNGAILIGDGTTANPVVPSGDVTIDNAGVTTIGATKITSGMYANTSIPSTAYGTGSIPPTALDPALGVDREILIKEISFETGEIGNNYVYQTPYAYEIERVDIDVTSPIAATDDATITLYIAGIAVTGGLITIPASSPLGTNASCVTTALNTGPAFTTFELRAAKPTAGGRVCAMIKLKRT